MIVSFYNNKIRTDVVEWQQRTFHHFGIDIRQINYGESHGSTGHAQAIDHFINNEWHDNTLQIFDIDCIPLLPFYEIESKGLAGIVARASHIAGSSNYVHPAYMQLTQELYNKLGRPSFKPNHQCDTGGQLTIAAKDRYIAVDFYYPTHVEKPEWTLDGGTMFGQGTTYADKIYHAFNGRWNADMFINKCKQVCGE